MCAEILGQHFGSARPLLRELGVGGGGRRTSCKLLDIGLSGEVQEDSQLLTQCSRCFCRTRPLDLDDFHQIRDAALIVFVVLLARQALNLKGHSRVRLLLLAAF